MGTKRRAEDSVSTVPTRRGLLRSIQRELKLGRPEQAWMKARHLLAKGEMCSDEVLAVSRAFQLSSGRGATVARILALLRSCGHRGDLRCMIELLWLRDAMGISPSRTTDEQLAADMVAALLAEFVTARVRRLRYAAPPSQQRKVEKNTFRLVLSAVEKKLRDHRRRNYGR